MQLSVNVRSRGFYEKIYFKFLCGISELSTKGLPRILRRRFCTLCPGRTLDIVLIEVEAEQHLGARSLAKYHKRYAPEIAVKTSMRAEMLAENGILRIPLYMISTLKRCADGRSKGK